MNKEFFKASEYYLIDVFNGEEKKSKIIFSVKNNSNFRLKNSIEVAIESKSKEIDYETKKEYYFESIYQAFMKSSSDSYKDNLDVINSEIASLLDISSSNVFKVINSNGIYGIVSIGIKEQDEQQLSMDILINKLITLIKSKGVTLTSWLKDYFSLPKTSKNILLNKEKDIISVIEMTIYTLSVLFRLSNDELENLKKDYIKMIFFDLISNNSERTFDSYSILIDNNSKFKRLSPIYDYNNELNVNSYYLLNNVYIDKNACLSTIYHKYYPYIKQISRGLTDNYGLYLESIYLIIDNNVDDLYASQIKDIYKSNLDIIKSLENVNSREYIAMTQTSINLNALNKNQMVHSKYKQRNVNKEEKVEHVSEISVKIEPKKVEKNTFSRIIVAIICIILLIAIAIGIVYLAKNHFFE